VNPARGKNLDWSNSSLGTQRRLLIK
jgi:hypothetical protein